jgi:hypothetical protein
MVWEWDGGWGSGCLEVHGNKGLWGIVGGGQVEGKQLVIQIISVAWGESLPIWIPLTRSVKEAVAFLWMPVQPHSSLGGGEVCGWTAHLRVPSLSRGLLFWPVSSTIEKGNQKHLFLLGWDAARGGGLETSTSPTEQMTPADQAILQFHAA